MSKKKVTPQPPPPASKMPFLGVSNTPFGQQGSLEDATNVNDINLRGPNSSRGKNTASYVETLVGNAKNITISSLTVNINNNPAQ